MVEIMDPCEFRLTMLWRWSMEEGMLVCKSMKKGMLAP